MICDQKKRASSETLPYACLHSSFILRILSPNISSTSYPLCLFVPYSDLLANHSNIQPPIHLHLLLFVPIIIFPFHVSLLLSTQRGIHLFPVSPAFNHPYNIKHEIFYSSHVLPFNTASTLHNIPIRKSPLFPISCRHYITGCTEIHTAGENNLVHLIQHVTIFSVFDRVFRTEY